MGNLAGNLVLPFLLLFNQSRVKQGMAFNETGDLFPLLSMSIKIKVCILLTSLVSAFALVHSHSEEIPLSKK